jgi:hypothetical protein
VLFQYEVVKESEAADRLFQHSTLRAAISGALGGSDSKWIDRTAVSAGLPPPSWGDADPFEGSGADDLDDEARAEIASIEADAAKQAEERRKRNRRR